MAGIGLTELTFETNPIWNLEHRMLGCNSILSKRAMWRHHRMKGCNSISNSELLCLDDVWAKRSNNPGDIISAVEGFIYRCEVIPICVPVSRLIWKIGRKTSLSDSILRQLPGWPVHRALVLGLGPRGSWCGVQGLDGRLPPSFYQFWGYLFEVGSGQLLNAKV